jgi:hypothetical protein
VGDDSLEILSLLLEQLSEFIVFLDLFFPIDLDGISFLLSLLEFWSSATVRV